MNFKATIVNDDIIYIDTNINDLMERLYQYIIEHYGHHNVFTLDNNVLPNCRHIRETGEYYIHTQKGNVQVFIERTNESIFDEPLYEI